MSKPSKPKQKRRKREVAECPSCDIDRKYGWAGGGTPKSTKPPLASFEAWWTESDPARIYSLNSHARILGGGNPIRVRVTVEEL